MNKYIDYSIKIFLIILGLADFFGLLPPSLDLFDKILTSLILLYFWFKLKPSLFMFGRHKKILDVAIIGTYYILVLNTFLRFLTPFFTDTTFALISQYVNYTSLIGGTTFLLLITIYVSLRINIGEKSVAHSIIHIFDKDNNFFNKIKGQELGWHTPLEFLLNFSVLYSIGIYFFSLINQWFVVSLDKSLLILAIIYAVKDLEKSSVKALNKIGKFDDIILGKITELFTTPKKFYLAFGFLFIFHYLSDIGTFFISYITNFIPLDTSYYALGKTLHQTLYQHFSTEIFTSFFQYISGIWVYILSGLGIILLLLIPISIMFMIVFNMNLKKLTYNKWYRLILSFMTVSILIFIAAPWITQVSINNIETGIIGVDFITHKISDNTIFRFEALMIVSIILFFFLNKIKKYKELTTVLYIGSIFYLITYAWHYFTSAFMYYLYLIQFFIQNANYFLIANFIVLLLMDFLFYIGGVIFLSYYTYNYIIKSLLRDIMRDNLIYVWTFLLIVIPQILIYTRQITLASTMIATFFIFTYAMFKELTGKEHRDDYILSVNMVIVSYQILLLLIIKLSPYIIENVLTFFSPFLIIVAAALIKNFFKLKLVWKLSLEKTITTTILGIIFGGAFYLIGEVTPGFTSIPLIIIYTLAIGFAEEMMFRHIIYSLAKQAFKHAIYIQAIIFSLIHLLSRPFNSGSIGYILLLYTFAIIAAKSVRKNNISHAIVLHFITNLTMILLHFI